MTAKQHKESQRLLPIGKAGIESMRAIVAEKQLRKINQVAVDLYTASIVTQIYDALNDANKAKIEALPVVKVCGICMKLAA